MSAAPRSPRAFVIEPADPDDAAAGRPRATPGIIFEPEPDAGAVTVVPPAPLGGPRRMRWGALLAGASASLAAMWAGLAVSRLVEEFFARAPVLGWLALGLAGLAAAAAAALIGREAWALARLRRIAHIQAEAAHAINADDAASAKRALAELRSLYAARPDAQLGLRELRRHDGDIMDGRDRMRLAERHLLSWRDAEAHRIIAHAARRITLLTTVAPTAALDMLLVAVTNLRMLRELATLYGGRPSALSTLRLVRMVMGHLAVTGGIALSDNLIQHVVGRGVLGRLSARFGEGTVNGILTARVGLAARDVCRPIPQEPAAKDTLSSLVKELLTSAPEEKPE